MAKKAKRTTTKTKTGKRRNYRRRTGRSGLSGLLGPSRSSKPKMDIKTDLIDIAATAVGTFAAAKGASILSNKLNKGKMVDMAIGGAVVVAGIAGGAFMGKNPVVKSLSRGVAIGGALKLAEKALGKDNLLAGLEDDSRPAMLPGIGDVGQADLPELEYDLSGTEAPATGGDYEYRMGTPSEQLSGNEEFIAY